ncbi:hypothetical protein Q2K19_07445 [Micromonospora soli]|uniref:hypothetical protein n=1 Tax=Micromonospora sp. NBRC 110009 TaxID=3061627 RepID=UPI0026736230|nr:hypothetical protein [Micromonospora sp. NBRC 110009]WKU00308.1 hypothetical protein Q2K19_07445 [Micromonospora sp. NBRC 110009]
MTPGATPSGSEPDEHAPLTPDWTCGTCGDEWPCVTKRSRLLREYRADRASLSVYLGSCLAAATHDLHTASTPSLQDRFIGWVPRSPRTS